MKSGRAKIGIFQKMRIKNLMWASEVRLKKLDSFTLETSKNHLIRNFLRSGRLRVKILKICPKNVRGLISKYFEIDNHKFIS